MQNLLCNLCRWAHRQDENFVTEACAFLLDYLLDHEPHLGRSLLAFLCGGPTGFWNDETHRPVVTTQWSTEEGRPDI